MAVWPKLLIICSRVLVLSMETCCWHCLVQIGDMQSLPTLLSMWILPKITLVGMKSFFIFAIIFLNEKTYCPLWTGQVFCSPSPEQAIGGHSFHHPVRLSSWCIACY